MVDVELLYRQQLTEADRQVLASVAGPNVEVTRALGMPALESALFSRDDRVVLPLGVSPFLAFAVAVHRTAETLETQSFVEERWTPRSRIPVFDVADLRALLADPTRRYFLVELLASYTRVTSGVTWTRTARGWRRRRYSELDPRRLAELLEVVDTTERPGVYRRLGDVSLFLLGVFPDSPSPLGIGAATERLLRISGLGRDSADEIGEQPLLELLGARWYHAAVASAKAVGSPVTASFSVVDYMADHFRHARRVLNAVTDRYLFPLREQWFGAS